MHYPYDVDRAILWLGNMVDQIFVFFDPIGQALCRRTLNLVEKLNGSHSDKIHFFLSKADEAGPESDRQKVMMQIVQELCKRPGLNKCGFEMPTIYIPDSNLIRTTQCTNQIESVCNQIEKAINYTIQNTLNSLEKDCDTVTHLIQNRIEEDNRTRNDNLRATFKGLFWVFLASVVPLLTLISSFTPSIRKSFGDPFASAIETYFSPIRSLWAFLPKDYHFHATVILVLASIIFLAIARYTSRLTNTLTRKEKKILMEQREYIREVIRLKKVELYQSYLSEIVSGQELEPWTILPNN